MSEKINAGRRVRSAISQKCANLLCWGRIGATPFIAEHATNSDNPRTWAFGGMIALFGATDKLDGMLSRYSARLTGKSTSERGAWLDQLSDKIYVHGALGGIAVGALTNGRPAFGAVCAANQAVMVARDVWVTRERKNASNVGVPTLAQKLGKIKTAAQITAVSVAASPIANYGAANMMNGGEVFASAAIASATALSVASGFSLVNSLREQQEVPLEPPIVADTAAA